MKGLQKKLAFMWAVFAFFSICIGSTHTFADGESRRRRITLSLNKTVQLAFINNKEIQIQAQEVEAAKADLLGANSEFLPTVDVDYSYTYNDGSLTSSLGQIGTGKKDVGVFAGYKNDNILSTTLKETIFRGGSRVANFKQTELRLKAQKEALRAKKLDIEFEAKRLYHGLQYAYETKRIAENLVTQAEAHYEDVKNKFRQGTASRFDLLQSKVHVSRTIPALVDAASAVELIKAELKKLLSLDMKNNVEPAKPLSYSEVNVNEGEFLDIAYMQRPEMILKSLGVDIKKWGISFARAGNLPTVEAKAGYLYRSNNLNNMFNERHNNWEAGISVSIPVFDGFATKAKIDNAKAKYSEAELEKENMEEQIAVDIRRGCLELLKAESIISSQEDSVVEAKEAVRLSEISYDNGVVTNLDVLDAQVALSEVEKNLAAGIYDYIMAKAYLDRTMGAELLKEAGNE